MFSHKIPRRGTVHKTLCRLGCGFSLSGLSTSVEQCGKPLESRCPPCRYITHHGVGCDVIAITESAEYLTETSEGLIQSSMSWDMKGRKRTQSSAKHLELQQNLYACVQVCVHACPRASACARGYITSWQRTGGLMCFSFALWTSRPLREEWRQTLCDAHQHSFSFKHPLTPIRTHTHKGNYHTFLPRACQSTVSISPQTDTLTDGEGLREQLNGCLQNYKERRRNPSTSFPRPGPHFTLCPENVGSNWAELRRDSAWHFKLHANLDIS